MIFEKIKFDFVRFSEEVSIFSDIEKSDVMISSNGSTTFIDGLVGNIPVINLVLPDFYIDVPSFNGLYNISNSKDFNDVINNLLDGSHSKTPIDIDELCSMNSNWEKVILDAYV